MLFYDLILVCSLLVNVYGSKILPHTNSASGKHILRAGSTQLVEILTDFTVGVLHLLGFLILLIVLYVMSYDSKAYS